ncbi:MAG: hypothetical protein J6A10_08340 [Peptococcaceae bacterium]|nr:hypothetical protein [Peptococcaceae bacterium]
MKNKKLFAILTLVCFMFTLMPVAAFAGVVTPAYGSIAEQYVNVETGDEVKVAISKSPAAAGAIAGVTGVMLVTMYTLLRMAN